MAQSPVLVENVLNLLFQKTGVSWAKLAAWPPDVFAAAGYLLYVTGAYKKAICNNWWTTIDPKHPSRLTTVGQTWREAAAESRRPPTVVMKEWNVLWKLRKTPVQKIQSKRALLNSLLDLVAMSDVASQGFGLPHPNYAVDEPEYRLLERADVLLSRGPRRRESSTLGLHANADIVCVLPKMHTPQVGLTLRSLTHHLSLCPTDEVRPVWNSIKTAQSRRDHNRFNLLLVPIPDTIEGKQFQEILHTRSGRHRMPPDYRSFTFTPASRRNWLRSEFRTMITKAVATTADKFIHGVVLPELSLASPDEFAEAYFSLQLCCPGAFLVAGVAEAGLNGSGEARNCAYYAIPQVELISGSDVESADVLCTQAKHHKWKITPQQVADYGLNATLDPTKIWWEHIEVADRRLNFFALKQWLTFTFVICEDLARQEPAARLVRAVGPNLVIALLMDNEQAHGRWPARYATVLAEDPGSSVLTLTCRGMAALGAEVFYKKSRKKHIVALWRDVHYVHPVEMDSTAAGVILSLTREEVTEYSVDGRNAKVANLRLADPKTDVIQVKIPKRTLRKKASAR